MLNILRIVLLIRILILDLQLTKFHLRVFHLRIIHMNKRLLIILAFLLIGISAKVQAYDFNVFGNGQTLYFNITSSISPFTVQLTSEFIDSPYYSIKPTGSITIPETVIYGADTYSVTSIASGTFERCDNLTSITIPASITSIGNGAFKNCTSLDTVFYNAINAISFGANNALVFEGCSSLRSIIIGDDVINIPSYTFSGIHSLESIKLNSIIPPTIQTNSFNGVSRSIPVYVPCLSLPDYQAAGFWNDFTNYQAVRIPQYIDESICQGEFYTDYGVNIDTSGIYHLSYDCDSIVLTLNVKPISITSLYDSINQGQTYSDFEFNFIADTSGIYTKTLQAANDCDSIVELNLFINPTYNDTIIASICQGETYDLYGFNKTLTGFYTQDLLTLKGCDSIVNLSLTVNPTYHDTITGYICQGEVYDEFGFTESEQAIYTQILETVNGCDSIVNLKLIVTPLYNYTIAASICQGETYDLFDFNETASGLYTKNLQTTTGCDSIVHLSLIVNPSYDYTITSNICQAEIYNQYGFNEDETGFYTQNLQTIKGCDSIVNLNLVVNPTYLTTHKDTICEGKMYTKYGFSFLADTSRLYIQNLQTVNGCDSIIRLDLLVNPSYNYTITASICQEDIYNQFGFNEIQTGLFTKNLRTKKGCDSIVNLSLTVHPKYLISLSDSTCRGQLYNNYGYNFIADTSGLYIQNLQTINGCDSIVILNLIVNSNYTHTITASICKGAIYTLNGFNQSMTGFYTRNLQKTNGCDSTINLDLTVNPTYNDTITAEICRGNTYNQNGFNQNISGVYTQRLQTTKGCDSIVNLNLIVNPTYSSSFSATICEGETYTLNGFNKSIAGTYTKNLQTTKGCDSTVVLNLFVIPSYNNTITANIWQGTTYNLNGFNENKTGLYTRNLQKVNGCDSIINLNLIVNPIYNDTITASICRGSTYTQNGFNESIAGFYTQNLQTTKGCDSIINLNLIVNPTYSTTFNATICQGETYTLNGFNKNTSGIYTEVLQTTKGCDSLVTLNLTVNPTYNKTINASICQGTTYTLNQFNEYSAGTYTKNLQSINGCDSVVHLNLVVNPVYNDTITASICLGSTYALNGFNESTAGFYTQHLYTKKGCDSIVNLSLIVNPTYATSFNATICQGETYTQNGFNQSLTGTYTANLQTAKGCDSIVTLHLNVYPSFSKTITAEICKGNSYTLNGFNESTTGTFTQSLHTIKGCDSIIVLNLKVNEVAEPTSLALNNIKDYFKLSWQGNSERYIIYRDNDSIFVTTTKIFKDTNVVNGVAYCYQVKALEGDCESEKVEVCQVFIGLDDIIINNAVSITLYPNPASGSTTLKAEGLTKVVDVFIYDITGRYLKTYKLEPNQKELNIDLTGLAKGIYQIKVFNQTKKLIVN